MKNSVFLVSCIVLLNIFTLHSMEKDKTKSGAITPPGFSEGLTQEVINETIKHLKVIQREDEDFKRYYKWKTDLAKKISKTHKPPKEVLMHLRSKL